MAYIPFGVNARIHIAIFPSVVACKCKCTERKWGMPIFADSRQKSVTVATFLERSGSVWFVCLHVIIGNFRGSGDGPPLSGVGDGPLLYKYSTPRAWSPPPHFSDQSYATACSRWLITLSVLIFETGELAMCSCNPPI